jgi:hypothetical protein
MSRTDTGAWLKKMPAWEADLWRDALRAAGPQHRDPPGRPGDWIPYGRAPIGMMPAREELTEVAIGAPDWHLFRIPSPGRLREMKDVLDEGGA